MFKEKRLVFIGWASGGKSAGGSKQTVGTKSANTGSSASRKKSQKNPFGAPVGKTGITNLSAAGRAAGSKYVPGSGLSNAEIAAEMSRQRGIADQPQDPAMMSAAARKFSTTAGKRTAIAELRKKGEYVPQKYGYTPTGRQISTDKIRENAQKFVGQKDYDGGLSQVESANEQLASLQEDILSTISDVPVRGPAEQAETIAGVEMPERVSMAEQYEELRDLYNVEDLEDQLVSIEAEEEEIEAAKRQRINEQRDKRVSMGVMAGRIGEVERQELERLDYLRRQKQTLINQLNNKYAVVGQIMNFTQQDYTNAVAEYNSAFNQNMQVLNYMQGVKSFDATQEQYEKTEARANLQVLYNKISEGELTYDDLGEDQKMLMNKLEAQAGYPPGLIGLLKNTNPKSNIVSSSNRQGPDGNMYLDIVTRDPITGEVSVKSVALGKYRMPSSGGGGKTAEQKEYDAFIKWGAEAIARMQDPDPMKQTSYESEYSQGMVKFPTAGDERIKAILTMPSTVEAPDLTPSPAPEKTDEKKGLGGLFNWFS